MGGAQHVGQRGDMLHLLQCQEGQSAPQGSRWRDEAQDGALHALALRAAPKGSQLPTQELARRLERLRVAAQVPAVPAAGSAGEQRIRRLRSAATGPRLRHPPCRSRYSSVYGFSCLCVESISGGFSRCGLYMESLKLTVM